MNDDTYDNTLTVIIALLACMFGFCVGSMVTESGIQKQAIEHNAAHYDSKTGEFMWNDAKANATNLAQSINL